MGTIFLAFCLSCAPSHFGPGSCTCGTLRSISRRLREQIGKELKLQQHSDTYGLHHLVVRYPARYRFSFLPGFLLACMSLSGSSSVSSLCPLHSLKFSPHPTITFLYPCRSFCTFFITPKIQRFKNFLERFVGVYVCF